MKIIDLLNKIANGEDVPKKMKIKQWEYNEENENLKYELFDRLFEEDVELNDEVEILEEEKKIPEKIPLNYADDRKPEEVYEYLRCSYNQLIDYLKSKGE